MINDQSTRLMAMARIQGTGEECRMIGASRVDCCVDWGMVVPSDLVAGSKTLSVTVLARVVEPRRHFSQPDSLIVVCSIECTSRKNRRANQPPSTDTQPSLTAPALPRHRRSNATGRFFASPRADSARDAGLNARRMPFQSQNGRARCGCPREKRGLQMLG